MPRDTLKKYKRQKKKIKCAIYLNNCSESKFCTRPLGTEKVCISRKSELNLEGSIGIRQEEKSSTIKT